MYTKTRKIIDSKTKNKQGLSDKLTRIQYDNMELILNSTLNGCKIFDPRNGGFYKRNMIPCSLNDISKASGKRIHKLFKVLSAKGMVKQLEDVRGRLVWVINPDLYWDYVGFELYYNRWWFATGYHRLASEIVNLSLHYGYYYNCYTMEPIRKIPRYHWDLMCKWWRLLDNDISISLIDFEAYQPETGITDKLRVKGRE